MYVNFKSLKTTNFRSVTSASLSYTIGVNLVVGDNQVESNADSNGSGKSTFFVYALTYLIYGKFKTPDGKVKKTGFIQRGCKFCEVEGVLSINEGPDITIIRGRKGNKPYLKIKGAETPVVGSQDLSYLIGCSFDAFISQFVLTRASLESSLFYGTDTKRKDFFLSVAGIEKMINISTEFLKSEKASYSIEALELRTMLSIEQRFDNIKDSIDEKNNQLIKLTTQYNNAKNIVDKYQTQFSEVTDKLLQTQDLLLQSENHLIKLLEFDDQFRHLSSMYERRGSLSSSISQLQKEETSRINYIKNLQVLAEGVCDKCNSFISKKHVNRVVKEVTETIKGIKSVIVESTNEFNSLINEIREIEQLSIKSKQMLQSGRTDIIDYKGLIVTVQAELKALNVQKSTNQIRMKEIQEEFNFLTSQIEYLKSIRLVRQNRIESFQAVTNCFVNFESACASWIAYLKQKLPAYALKQIAEFMSSFAARCLRSMWDTRVSVDIFFDSSTEKLNIIIKDTLGHSTEIEDLSTGEQCRVFLSLAIGSIIATKSFKGWSSNILILDEVMDGLDRSGRNVMVQLLNELSLQFKMCIYVITHHSDIYSFDGGLFKMVKDIKGSHLVVVNKNN